MEKARRAASQGKGESVLKFRDDADRLLVGGTFLINAIGPPQEGKKKKGGKKGKGAGGKKKK